MAVFDLISFATSLLTSAVSILVYLGISYGLFRMARACGLRGAWMAWVPYCKIFLIGAIADHYCERVLARRTQSRRVLLWLYIAMEAFMLLGIIIFVVSLFSSIFTLVLDASSDVLTIFENEQELLSWILEGLLASLAAWVIGLIVTIIYLVFYYIALHRIYKLFAPEKATAWTVLSIFFIFLVPIFFVVLAKSQPVYPTVSYDQNQPLYGGYNGYENTPYSL